VGFVELELHREPADERPADDKRLMGLGVVHIGIGGFNRSHLAVYPDDLLSRERPNAGVNAASASLKVTLKLHTALAEQDYLYGLLLMDNSDVTYRVRDRGQSI
jgi:mannitol 2-dehydrogenase